MTPWGFAWAGMAASGSVCALLLRFLSRGTGSLGRPSAMRYSWNNGVRDCCGCLREPGEVYIGITRPRPGSHAEGRAVDPRVREVQSSSATGLVRLGCRDRQAEMTSRRARVSQSFASSTPFRKEHHHRRSPLQCDVGLSAQWARTPRGRTVYTSTTPVKHKEELRLRHRPLQSTTTRRTPPWLHPSAHKACARAGAVCPALPA